MNIIDEGIFLVRKPINKNNNHADFLLLCINIAALVNNFDMISKETPQCIYLLMDTAAALCF